MAINNDDYYYYFFKKNSIEILLHECPVLLRAQIEAPVLPPCT